MLRVLVFRLGDSRFTLVIQRNKNKTCATTGCACKIQSMCRKEIGVQCNLRTVFVSSFILTFLT